MSTATDPIKTYFLDGSRFTWDSGDLSGCCDLQDLQISSLDKVVSSFGPGPGYGKFGIQIRSPKTGVVKRFVIAEHSRMTRQWCNRRDRDLDKDPRCMHFTELAPHAHPAGPIQVTIFLD